MEFQAEEDVQVNCFQHMWKVVSGPETCAWDMEICTKREGQGMG